MRGLPPEDLVTSPSTGWTRDHWTATADGLLAAVAPYRSPRGGRIDLPGAPSGAGVVSDGLEGFARTFLLAALRVAGEAGADPAGLLPPYVEGLVSGPGRSSRGSRDAWPRMAVDGLAGQPMVEAASVALGLLLAPGATWEQLSPPEQDALADWLADALEGDPSPNNWCYFPLVVAALLERVGRGDARTRRTRERADELCDGWYVGDGWYSDGDARAFDHYGGWAMHLYPVLLAHLEGDRERMARLGPRLREFLGSYAATFDANGSPLHQGRSLTYRFAAVAPVVLGEVTGWTPLAPGATRRIASSALRYFLSRGALEQGLLTRGWHGPHAATVQGYSGPASPYWASKAFLGLLLPATADLWTAVEAPPPAAGPDRALPVPSVGWLVQTTQEDGLVRVHNHGSDKAEGGPDEPDPLYTRLAHSTRTGPTHRGNAPDNHVRLVVRGRGSRRGVIHPLGAGDGWAASWHRPLFRASSPGPGSGGTPVQLPQARITSTVLARGRWEVHVHRVTRVPRGTTVVASGWALAGRGPQDLVATTTADAVVVEDGSTTSRLVALHGWTSAAVVRAPAGTAFGAWALLGELTGEVASDGLLVAAASLSGAAGPPDQPRVEVDGLRVRVRWARGPDTVCDAGAPVPLVSSPGAG